MEKIRFINSYEIELTDKIYSIVWASSTSPWNKLTRVESDPNRVFIPSNNKHALGITLC